MRALTHKTVQSTEVIRDESVLCVSLCFQSSNPLKANKSMKKSPSHVTNERAEFLDFKNIRELFRFRFL